MENLTIYREPLVVLWSHVGFTTRNPLQLPVSTHYATLSTFFLWPSPVLFTPIVADTDHLNNKLGKYMDEQVE